MKKHFLLLLVTLFVAVGTAKADTTRSGLWSDNTDATWGSNYAESNEFYISTAAQLAQFAYMVNNSSKQFSGKTVRLIADIDLSAHYWVPIGYKEARAFAGTFDAEGHTIRGVYFNSGSFPTSGNVFCGLFGVNGAKGTVSNVHVANSTFEARYNVGGVVAYNKGTVEYCSVASDVIVRSTAPVSGDQGAIRFAGIVASNLGTVRGCVSHADLSDQKGKGRNYIGGIVGHNFGRVESCVFLGDAARLGYDTQDHIGPIVGSSVESSISHISYSNNYYTQSAVATLDTGKAGASLAYTISTSTSGVSISFDTPEHGVVLNGKCYAPSGQSVQFRVVPDDFFKGVATVTANGTPLTATDGKYTVTVASTNISIAVTLTAGSSPAGSGTNTDPYIINSTAHWNALATAVNDGNENINKGGVSFFRLDADITVSAMIGTSDHPFESTFDGNGHKLTFNLQTSDADYCAPFSYTRGAEIENLIVDGSIKSSGHYAGGIIGHAEGTFTVLNCVVKTNIESTGSGQAVYDGGFIGGVFGESSVNIIGCVFEGSITSSGNTCFGGFVGKAEGASSVAPAAVTISNSLFDPRAINVTNTTGSETFVITGNYSSVSTKAGDHVFYTKQLGTQTPVGTLVYASAYMPTEEPTIKYGMIDKYQGGLLYNGVYFSADHKGFYDYLDNMPLIGYYLNRGTVNAKFNGRKLYKDGAWNTLCLPFNMTADELSAAKENKDHPLYGATVWEMDVQGWYNASNEISASESDDYCYQTSLVKDPANNDKYLLYLYFKDATTIEAGMPYLVRWDKPEGYNPSEHDISDPTFGNVTIKASLNTIESYDGSVLFVPIFSPVVLEKGNWHNLYVGTNNILRYPSPTKDFTLKTFRGYFQLMAGDESASDPLAPSLDIVSNIDDNNETTGIITMSDEFATPHSAQQRRSKMSDVWYTLDGRKLDGKPTKKGLYIHNGNKLVIK